MMGRVDTRQSFTVETRVRLLESDLDDHDREASEFRSEVRNAHEAIYKEMKSGNRIVMGVLIALVTAAILLVLNVGLLAGGVGTP